MEQKRGYVPAWLQTNAWREILARIFTDQDTQLNLTPDWLINPATNRRLKLDLLYPQLGLAVRFEGRQGKNRRQRPSLEEEHQQQLRDEARAALCRQHGIELLSLDVTAEDPAPNFQAIDLSLSRASQARPGQGEAIRQARTSAASLGRRVRHNDDLRLYAELWEDRQYQIPEVEPVSPTLNPAGFATGMAVEHRTFGPGVILQVETQDTETLLTIDFGEKGHKTLAASLIGDKLRSGPGG
jgi:hypothetical protein